ncbi:hypothetical protein [Antrihabitans cavernicola]|uniref:Uncharacterized protein n=1 Tax=Antrihabitans cavernicola TaxID=2495913 RepID=A0A5A7SGV1_9NOCA|nr:hypothetical protein [Spelaeibacter cavernicola]KAA0023883.1 hypothetical protein FOY51_04665 [Spelaeibacter cavernicola]
MRFGEALGLVAAMIHGGAELVTASRWTLPTDAAYAAVGSSGRPLQDAVSAIDDAHESADPVATINAWQRRRLDAWRASGAIEHSPVLWSSFATVDTASQ